MCPFAPIEPDLIAEGYPVFADDSAGIGWKGSEALTWDFGRPILLACLVTIASDKSEAARARGTGGNIGGYHDRCRLHLLPSAHVAKILEMASHFDLLEQFPTLGHQGLCENAGASLERWRQKAIDAVGLPPNGRMTDEWLQKRAHMICGVPWVQRCSAEWPGGELDEQGQPVLVPLTRYGAELCNGSSWLYLEEHEQGTKRYEQVRTALANIIGRSAPKPLPQSAEVSAFVKRLHGELETAKEHIEALKKRNGELEEAVTAIKRAIEPLKR